MNSSFHCHSVQKIDISKQSLKNKEDGKAMTYFTILEFGTD